VKLGEYELNQIYTGDARELAKGIPDESVDLVLTDPPFGIDFKYSNGYKDDPKQDYWLMLWIILESQRIFKPGGLCFVFQAMPKLNETFHLFPDGKRIFSACKNFTQFRPTAVQYGFDPVIFWQKEGESLIKPVAGKRDWHIGNTALYVTQKSSHSCPRPLNTIEFIVENFCPENGVVCDFFIGSGTTAVAAKETKRSFIGFEIDEETAQKARQRVLETPELLPFMYPDSYQGKLFEGIEGSV